MHLNEGVHPLPKTEWDGCGTTSQLATSIYIYVHIHMLDYFISCVLMYVAKFIQYSYS